MNVAVYQILLNEIGVLEKQPIILVEMLLLYQEKFHVIDLSIFIEIQ